MLKKIFTTFIFAGILAAILSTQGLYAERIRGAVVETISAESESQLESGLKLHELVGFDYLPSDFIKGFEIELHIPEPAMEFRESFLFRIFSDLNSAPDTSRKTYYGSEVLRKPFPVGKSLFIAIPLDGEDVWRPSGVGVTSLGSPLKKKSFPLLFTIEPIMKGIPSSVSNAVFNFTVTPILHDIGKVELVFPEHIDTSGLTVKIDDETRPHTDDFYTLKTGIHDLKVSTPSTMPFSSTFGVEKGQLTSIDVKLEPAKSFVSFEAPQEAQIFFDGERLEEQNLEEYETKPGEHMVLVQLGEYSMSKKIHLNRGRNYKVSLFFDILVDED